MANESNSLAFIRTGRSWAVLSLAALAWVLISLWSFKVAGFSLADLVDNPNEQVAAVDESQRTVRTIKLVEATGSTSKPGQTPAETAEAIQAEKLARLEAEELKRLEAQEKASAQAKLDAQTNAQEQARIEVLARAEAQARAEEQARLEAQAQAEEQARLEAQAQAEEQARLDAQAQAEEQARLEAAAQAEEEARQQARAEAQAIAEQRAARAQEQARRLQAEAEAAERERLAALAEEAAEAERLAEQRQQALAEQRAQEEQALQAAAQNADPAGDTVASEAATDDEGELVTLEIDEGSVVDLTEADLLENNSVRPPLNLGSRAVEIDAWEQAKREARARIEAERQSAEQQARIEAAEAARSTEEARQQEVTSIEVAAIEPAVESPSAAAEADTLSAPRKTAYELLRDEELRVLAGQSDRVRFEPDSAVITKDVERPLDRMFDPLFLYSEMPVLVSVAVNEFNGIADDNELSLDRGRAIVEYLINRGLDQERFRIQIESGEALTFGTHRVRISTEEPVQ